jgi:uncharacterized protein YaaQ
MLNSKNSWAGQFIPRPSNPIRHLMTAVIQVQDHESAVSALSAAGIPVTQLASTGGFLGRRNSTLLIGLADGQEQLAVKILSSTCRRRVEYLATPLEGAPFQMPLSTPVTVGGATIFILEVDRYEEIE